jgi:molybdate transport system permease protein
VPRTPSTETRGSRPVLPPWPIAVPAAVALALLGLPMVALLVRLPWSQLPTQLASPVVGPALRLSLLCAVVATLVSAVLGVPLAWVLARTELPGLRVLRALVTVPLTLPPVVGGVALLLLLGRRGLLGSRLEAWFGISLPFTTAAVVVAQVFVAMPFLVLAVEGALAGADRRIEDAAATLGASPLRVFTRITLPTVAPGVAAGAVLCFARALGEFGATITFAGSFPGTTQTMPVAVYLALATDPDAAAVLSVLLLAVSVAVLVVLRGRWTQGALR